MGNLEWVLIGGKGERRTENGKRKIRNSNRAEGELSEANIEIRNMDIVPSRRLAQRRTNQIP